MSIEIISFKNITSRLVIEGRGEAFLSSYSYLKSWYKKNFTRKCVGKENLPKSFPLIEKQSSNNLWNSLNCIQNNSWNKILLVVGDYINTINRTFYLNIDLNQAVKPHGCT